MPNNEISQLRTEEKSLKYETECYLYLQIFQQKVMKRNVGVGEHEDTKHIYYCKYWNNEEYMNNENEKTIFEEIFTDNWSKLVKVFNIFEDNYQKRENYKTEQQNMQNLEKNSPSGILISDPLCSVIGYSNGNKH